MISPAYTPFSSSEAAQALGLSWHQYRSAVASGLLGKSVHFDGRFSMATGMHSLVDIVKYAVLGHGGRSNSLWVSEQVDEFLNSICCVYDDEPERLADFTPHPIERVLQEVGALAGNTDQELLDLRMLRALTANEWIRCYRQLCCFLMCDPTYASG